VRADVENARAGGGAAPKPQGPDAKKLADLLGMKYTEIPNNNIKKIVASRLLGIESDGAAFLPDDRLRAGQSSGIAQRAE
jgi:hypothetical protein